jgi:hypothetical protein
MDNPKGPNAVFPVCRRIATSKGRKVDRDGPSRDVPSQSRDRKGADPIRSAASRDVPSQSGLHRRERSSRVFASRKRMHQTHQISHDKALDTPGSETPYGFGQRREKNSE